MEKTGQISFAQRCRKAYQQAIELSEIQPDWLLFFREVLGVGGIVRRLFPDAEAQLRFEQTVEYAAIREMLGRLRQKSHRNKGPLEPTRVITVRLPKSVHESLRAEATARGTSMNQLCLSKLLRVIDQEFGPDEFPAE